ncbi:MAG: glycosyltransferase [Verrucomicrobia bacterium]|nr:glycosyltransferase [Verrucomicrobiota bacterium]
MIKPPGVSVLMAVHNGQRYLGEAIESLLHQTFEDFELVIVDDASTDDTPRLLKSLACRDRRIVLLRNDRNIGLAGSLNRGLAICRAPLVARADADDVFMPERLEKQVRCMEANTNVGVLGAAVEFIDEEGRSREDKLQHFHTQPSHLRFHTHLGCCFWHTTVMFRPELVRSFGGYDEERFTLGPEDYDLWARLIDKTAFQNLPEVLAKQRLHSASLTSKWEVGFKLYCSVSQRLLSHYLGRPLNEQEAHDVVTLFGWNRHLPQKSILNGIRLLREIRACARKRETRDTLAGFERQCVEAFLTEAAIMVYDDPAAGRKLILETIRWSPLTLFSLHPLMLGLRLVTPTVLRDVFKRAKHLLLGRISCYLALTI